MSTERLAVYVEVSRAAERDLLRLSAADHRRVAVALMHTLGNEPMPANADAKSLDGRLLGGDCGPASCVCCTGR